MVPPVDPILLEIGPFAIHWYGVLIVTGILLGARVAAYLAQRAGKNPEMIWDMLMIVVILAIIGARVYHVFSQPASGVGWDYYRKNPIKVFAIWEGGLGIYGGLLGGALGVIVFAAVRKLNTLQWLDFAAPGAAIGQAIGRWGNYINQELYGPPTTLPWGLDIPFTMRIAPYTDLQLYPESTRFHPTFLYESLLAFVLCLLLIWISERFRAKLRHGDVLILYLMGYGVIRFLTEMLRPDAWMVGNIAAAQIVSLVLVGVGLAVIIGRRLIKRQPQAALHNT